MGTALRLSGGQAIARRATIRRCVNPHDGYSLASAQPSVPLIHDNFPENPDLVRPFSISR
jgi:hypothetical protein